MRGGRLKTLSRADISFLLSLCDIRKAPALPVLAESEGFIYIDVLCFTGAAHYARGSPFRSAISASGRDVSSTQVGRKPARTALRADFTFDHAQQ